MDRGSFLFVESNTTGTGELLMKRARLLGFEIYLVTRNRYSFLKDSVAQVIEAETRSPGELVGVAAKLRGLAGIYSSSDYFVEAAPSAAMAMGLPGPATGANGKWPLLPRLRCRLWAWNSDGSCGVRDDRVRPRHHRGHPQAGWRNDFSHAHARLGHVNP